VSVPADDKGVSAVPDNQASNTVITVVVPGLGEVQVVLDGGAGRKPNEHRQDG
jgi:hypothetical protein